MRVLTARWVAGCIAAGSIALMAGALVLEYVDRDLLPASVTGWTFDNVSGQVVNLAVPVVGFVLASRRPANRIGWLFLTAGLLLAVEAFGTQYGLRALVAAPGSLPAGRAFAWSANSLSVLPIVILAFVFLLFPTGHLRSRRWRPAAWSIAAVFALAVVVGLVIATRYWSHPVNSFSSGIPAYLTATFFVIVAALVVGVAALVVRFARSSGEERLQLKWFAAAALLVVVTMIASFLANGAAVANVLNSLAFLCLFAAIAIAVLKYRLYDIDIVISKAVLYGSLAVFITAVYAALVVGIGTLVGNQRSPLLTALAAAVVAVAFQPARQWAGRLANRVVYGRRATPYQVLSDFAQRIGGTYAAEDVLPQMAQIVAAGTGAKKVMIWLRVGDELHPEASSDGNPPAGLLRIDGQVLPPLPDSQISVPVVHQGELLGAISITMPKDEPLRPAGQQLVTDVASQAGLALANAGLIEDLRASRQRLVTAQDEARRRLERNIHDGAQQDLVALAIKLQLGETTVATDPAQTGPIFGELKADAAGALENLRDLARGIYPPLLADLGLAAALNAQASKSPLPVTVEADRIRRFGQDTEAAVYFCCLEALQNTAKYAHATQARICLQASNGTLSFTVSDDGTGYDTRRTPMGSGLRNMADRLAALRGQLEIRSAPSYGTIITGHLPVPVTSSGISAQRSHPAEATTA
ncbi:MAG TPA: histidine kinase [Streptosporangiaceae bacterium]|nr:histidine kinase [Streptosporangiaceae bacterium]